jgi:hypothetical protein
MELVNSLVSQLVGYISISDFGLVPFNGGH